MSFSIIVITNGCCTLFHIRQTQVNAFSRGNHWIIPQFFLGAFHTKGMVCTHVIYSKCGESILRRYCTTSDIYIYPTIPGYICHGKYRLIADVWILGWEVGPTFSYGSHRVPEWHGLPIDHKVRLVRKDGRERD